MKVSVSFNIVLAAFFWVSGCGQKGEELGLKAETRSCPLYFPSENLCAEISWLKGPSADSPSQFAVFFWNKGTGSATGPLIDPISQVGAFLRMSCCGSISFPKIEKTSMGTYSVSEIRFTPGNWEVYIQLKNGEQVDKQFVKVQLDD
ncbi:hypothetical protein EBT16_02900 [bacterium]|nr:hypothetical protein [bacterium]